MATIADNRREAVKQEIERRGLRCVQQGKAWHVYGLNVDILTADLAHIEPHSLQPFVSRKHSSDEG